MMELGELPAGWTWATIDELVGSQGLFRDGDWVESKDQDPDGTVRLIQLADIGDGEFRNKSARFLTAAKAAELGCSYLRDGDLLIARMPDPLGRACLFPLKGEHKFVTVVDVCIVRFGHSQIDNRYFLYALNSPASRKRISDFQTGSTRKRISRGNLSTIEFPIPPLAEQHRIVAKIEELFSELDQGVASLKTAREQLKVYRQSLLKNAFEGKLTAAWRAAHGDQLETAATLQQCIARERQVRYQQQLADWQTAGQTGPKPKPPKPLPPLTAEELAELPDGWITLSVEQLCEIEDGDRGEHYPTKADFSDTGHCLFLNAKNVTKRGFVFQETSFISKEKHLVLRKGTLKHGDMVFTSRGTLGNIALYDASIPFECVRLNSGMFIIRGYDAALSPDFLYYHLNAPLVTRQIERLQSGTAQPQLPIREFKTFRLAIPSKREQLEIVQELESKLSEADQLDQTLATALQQADALRQSILKKAFSGQLVKQAKNEEPATALLERIRAGKSNGMNAPRNRRKSG